MLNFLCHSCVTCVSLRCHALRYSQGGANGGSNARATRAPSAKLGRMKSPVKKTRVAPVMPRWQVAELVELTSGGRSLYALAQAQGLEVAAYALASCNCSLVTAHGRGVTFYAKWVDGKTLGARVVRDGEGYVEVPDVREVKGLDGVRLVNRGDQRIGVTALMAELRGLGSRA